MAVLTSVNNAQEIKGKSGGIIYLKNGGSLKFSENITDSISIYNEKTKNRVSFKISNYKEIWKLSSEGWKLIFRNNESINTDRRIFEDDRFIFYFYDDMSKKIERKSISTDEVSKIIFDENIGELKQCPKCKNWWPQDFIFCPYDATELKWSNKE